MKTINIVDSLLSENNGVIKTADAVRAGLSRTSLCLLVKDGVLERIAHGQYIRLDDIPDELYILQQRSDKIVFSHETALFLHDMAERTPLQNSLTIPSNRKLSPVLAKDCKIYYIKPELMDLGKCLVSSKMGNKVVCYDIERTICDVFRSRNRIDSQVFAEAIKSYISRKDQNWKNLSIYAEVFGITILLRQYLEVLV